jgi:hypothetical protein
MREKFEMTAIVAFLGTVLAGFATFLHWSDIPADLAANYGVAVKDTFWVAAMSTLFVACVRFRVDYEMLGAGTARPGTGLRERYDSLRTSLAAKQSNEDNYARLLSSFLKAVEFFFGDSNASRHRAFLLNKPAALWTEQALERCLLLALLYPIGFIFFIWVISGNVGPTERALGLDISDHFYRIYITCTIIVLVFSMFIASKSSGSKLVISLSSSAVSFILSGLNTVASIFAIGLTGALTGAVVLAIALAIFISGASTAANAIAFFEIFIFSVLFFLGFGLAGAGAGDPINLAIGIVKVMKALVYLIASKTREWSKFLIVAEFIACLVAARWLSAAPSWDHVGPILLFIGVFTLVNAPFDWISIGLTGLLLRWGIERGGPWPYMFAAVDAVVASTLIAVLAVMIVISVDLFDSLAEIGGGDKARVLPPMQFYLAALRKQPQAPEFWWVYATLFSTMIPSIINLFIAGFSFLRGLPVLRDFLLSVMRENETMPPASRFAAALILTLQGSFAFVFALGAQALLAWGVIWHLMPMLGLGVLDLAEKVAM